MQFSGHILRAARQSARRLLIGFAAKLTSRSLISSEDAHIWRTTMMNDPHLTSVAKRVRKLERELSDAEWDDDPRFSAIALELEHYKKLQAEGKMWEPNF